MEKFRDWSAGRNSTETVIGCILYTTGNIEWFFLVFSLCLALDALNYIYTLYGAGIMCTA